ncbi:Outer membrane porin F precursor [Rhodobacteraceae bacterium THAF1]|uniref:OmpA family protein n=1 Tax=Palleronia sp. THAF1 TaxID=2587842 RepID=UPI000F403696|nr:OmpA family protein [Palleronia sp. THAF1]QFU07822.1 Outer membrane porin F precursor [Palleronia sp. THAF1]VDC25637.1 Outer membrane porin F precursor [Rhodobacteraceae bacterium THAF1]
MTFTKITLLTATAASLTLAGCVTSPTTGEPDRVRNGALVGAAVGALAGASQGDDANDRQRNALIGAVVGGGAGAAVGSVLERQAAELRAQLGTGIIIENTGSELIVRMPQDILFDTDSAQLNMNLNGDLRQLAANLNKYSASTIEVQGHTDSTGSDAYNQNLSQRRAQAITQVLVANNVSPSRLRAVGYGESRPVASNDSAQGRQLNRRVQIVIRPNQQ